MEGGGRKSKTKYVFPVLFAYLLCFGEERLTKRGRERERGGGGKWVGEKEREREKGEGGEREKNMRANETKYMQYLYLARTSRSIALSFWKR